MSTTITSIERFMPRRRSTVEERCELCAARIDEMHGHVVDRVERRILCACRACGISFEDGSHDRFRSIPTSVRVPAPPLDATALDGLGVPVGLAFFFRSSKLARWVGVFPSPAGPTEAELPAGLPELGCVEEDVEALLVHRVRTGPLAQFIVPIDLCYELAALVRRGWRGIDGGNEAREAIDAFFTKLAERARKGTE